MATSPPTNNNAAISPPHATIDLTDDATVLGATIWGEARGEPLLGQQAVAAVVMNRVTVTRVHPRKQFGDGGIGSACLAPWQFSCWNGNDPNRAEIAALDFANPDTMLAQCIAIARAAIAGKLPDISNGACFYKSKTLAWPTDWGAPEMPCAVIGRHAFYRLAVIVPKPRTPAMA